MSGSGSHAPRSRLVVWLLACALVAAIFAVYSNTWHVPMVLDDEATITRNPTVVVLADSWKPPLKSGLTSGGRPLVNISLALNYHFVGEAVEAYHVTNAALHALAALALFGAVRRTVLLPRGAPRRGALGATGFAWMAAALWALHPLQTESVTYIVQRAEVIAGLFIWLSLYCFARYIGTDGAGAPTQRPGARAWAAAAWLACLAGMASKEICASIPVLVFLYDRTFVAGTFVGAWRARRNLHLAFASTWILLGFLVWGGGGRDGTVGFDSEITAWDYLQTQAWGIVRYVQVSLWPAGLIFDYGVFVEERLWVVMTCGAVVLALLALTGVALRRWPAAGFLGVLFFAVLAPTSSFIPVITQTMAEHRMYVPLAAVVLLVAGLLGRWLPRLAAAGVLSLVAAVLAVAAHQRNTVYASDITLWTDSYTKRPENGRALLNLGLGYSRRGDQDQALAFLRRAEQLSPEDATIPAALGQVLFRAGRVDESLAELERAFGMDADSWYVRLNYGNSLLAAGRVTEAIEHLEYVRRDEPYHPDIEFNLGNAYLEAGDIPRALAHYEEALRRDPDDLPARVNYAGVLRDHGRLDEALDQYREGLRRFPTSPEVQSNYGLALAARGHTEAALAAFREAIRLAPEAFELRMNLILALSELGRFSETLPHYAVVVELLSPTADLCNAYGVALAHAGELEQARGWLRRAITLEPDLVEAQENLAAVEQALQP